MESKEISAYYQHTKSVPLASRLSMAARKKMFGRFMALFAPTAADSVLDVGVTSDYSRQESNYFERLYPYQNRITCVGTEDGSHLTKLYSIGRYESIEPGKPLPFANREFDLTFSNAVLEHAGSREMQTFFLNELGRVSRRGFFVTTPNRWFPVEHHTGLPLLHYLPTQPYRYIIGHTPFKYWAEESHLNILSRSHLLRILPREWKTRVEIVTTLGLPSNLIAYGTR